MTLLDAVAALLGLANIILIVRRSVWNYPFALAMVTLFGFTFFEAKLYSDAGLQVFFFIVNLYGWWAWNLNRAAAGEVVVERLRPAHHALWIAGTLAAIFAWGTMMGRLTDASFPYWDASIAMLSVVAQILMAQRYLENWNWWIVVNLISVPLYLIKALWVPAGLYVVFLAIAIWGWIEWRRIEAETRELRA